MMLFKWWCARFGTESQGKRIPLWGGGAGARGFVPLTASPFRVTTFNEVVVSLPDTAPT